MTGEPERLLPTTPDELADSIAVALRFRGRKRVHYADDSIARIAAEHLVKHLQQSGFVVLKKPPSTEGLGALYRPPASDKR